ncbi:MAG: DUF1559 domain-containing protein [Pirellulales bacterium]|nr:DUF1559 domain-containing protein [Pirellulales bacterium]
MAATSGFAVTWVWLLLLSGAGALPLGGAPLPLDPVLSNIAPPECLWYAAYSGQGPADAASDNQTEQLFAEPQVRRFAEELETQIVKAVRRAAGPSREGRVHAEHLPKLAKLLLTRPLAAYLEKVELGKGDDRRVNLSAAIVLGAGDQRNVLEAAVDDYLKLIPPGNPPVAAEKLAGLEWRRLPTPPEAPAVRFGWKDDYFIIALGDQAPQQVVQRMAGEAPQWLAELRQEHPVAREASIAYVNIEAILNVIRPQFEAKDPKVWPTIEKLGLTSIRALHAVSGFDEAGCTSQVHVAVDGDQRPGLLGLLPHRPLEAADLALVPKDALAALAASLDAGEVFDRVAKLVGALDPHAEERLERGLWEVETKLGVNLREDVLAALDDAWVVYMPSGDPVVSWLNSAAAVRVKDADRLQQAVAKLVEKAKAELARRPQDVTLMEAEVEGRTLYWLQFSRPAPVAPAWCVGDGWLVASLSPQAVRAALARHSDSSDAEVAAADSLAAVEGVHEALGAEGGAAALAYQDTPRLVSSLYPWLTMGLQMVAGQLRKEGIEFDLTAIPTRETIVRHLRPSISAMSYREDGLHVTSHGSLPGGGNVAAAAPVGAALLLPAVQAARTAAGTAQDINDLKQIMLGILNYESATKHLPTDLYSEDGKPLLSWRVAILPYLEQPELYRQFKLDEPWDSPANRKLMANMPDVYRSGADRKESDKTRYLAFSGPDALFRGQEPIQIRQIEDGTSQTLAVVRVAPGAAVEWTKPADLRFDPQQPFAGLETPEGFFLTAFCDGSVRRLSLAIGEETLRRLVNRHDGEIIDRDALSAPPAPQRPRQPPGGDTSPDDQ